MLPPMPKSDETTAVLAKTGMVSGQDFDYDRRAKKFKPITQTAQLASDYGLALADNLEKLARINYGESALPNSSYWVRWENDPDIQWRVQRDQEQGSSKYAIRALNERGQFEVLSSEIDKEKKHGAVEWQLEGFLPGALKTKFDIKQSDSPEEPSSPENIEAEFDNVLLTPFSKLTYTIHGQKSMAANPQRSFNTLVSEAKWLVNMIKNSVLPASTQIGPFKMSRRINGVGSVYKIERTQDGSEFLEVRVDDAGKTQSIRRESNRAGAKYSLTVLPRDDIHGGIDLEDDAELVVINQKAYRDRLAREIEEKHGALLWSARLAGRRVNLEQFELPRDTKPIYDDIDTKVFHVGYNKQGKSQRDEHREALFTNENLERLLPGTGLIYRAPKADEQLSFSPENEHDQLDDFFKYTKIPPGSISCAFVDSARNTKVKDHPQGKMTDLSTFGDSEIRSRILKKSPRPTIGDRKELKQYLQGIGTNMVSDDVEKAIYRWGIRNSKDDLAKIGIVYRKSETGKDKIYCVDLEGRRVWGKADIKHVYGNKLKTAKLLNYPNQTLLTELFPKPEPKDEEEEDSYYCARPGSTEDLKKVFSAMDFDVADDIETERFIESIKASEVEGDTPILKHLKTLSDKGSRPYVYSVKMKLAKKLLADQNYTDIEEVQSSDGKDKKTYLKYKSGEQVYIALASDQIPLKAKREDTKAVATSFGAQARYIILDDFNLAKRTATLNEKDIV